jgi:dextranase
MSLTRRAVLRRALLALAYMPRRADALHLSREQEERGRVKTSGQHIALQDVWADRASYQPDTPAAIHLALVNEGPYPTSVRIAAQLAWLDEHVATIHREIDLPPGERLASLSLNLPTSDFRGYGVEVSVLDTNGALLARGSTALDVLQAWPQAPRYGFLSDFTPGDPVAAQAVATLSRYHINVVQFYDWMWRHYELMPPQENFVDALGRQLSLRTVREKVAACATHGMAALGYAAVYGAEPEFALNHPDEMLYDDAGEPYSIEKLFYIMNIHRGNPWRAQILPAMAQAVREVPFDGLHLDQYGFPKNAFGPPPARTPYDLAQDFPLFIDDARATVRRARPGTRVIFNAVGNWPIETIASTSQDATYIEVWSPYDTYSDLQTLILEARRLAPAKQVILAAYLKPLEGAIGDALPPAETATRLASAAIWANGGFHLLMGEQNGALCDPYYPKYATLMPDFARVMRRLYDFVVRYENVLSDRQLVTAAGSASLDAVHLTGATASPFGEPGTVWTIVRSMPSYRTISLINLVGTAEANWNTSKPSPPLLLHLDMDLPLHGEAVERVFVASPDEEMLDAQSLPFTVYERAGTRILRVRVPRLHYWSLVVVRVHAS